MDSNAYGVGDPIGAGEGDVPDGSQGESGFAAMKGVKWQIKTRIETEFLLAMRYIHQNPVVNGDEEGVLVADRAISHDHSKSPVAGWQREHFLPPRRHPTSEVGIGVCYS